MSMLAKKILGRAAAAASFAGLVSGAGAAGCAVSHDGPTDDTLDANAPFIAISKGAGSVAAKTLAAPSFATKSLKAMATTGTAAAPSEDFYLAINRNELGKKWFLSAFIKQYFPGAVSQGAARSLGTRVVSFKIQNGKLFMFDVADGKAQSETFTPELVVDAFPIVADYREFTGKANADRFVLIDPSAGIAGFNLLSEAVGAGGTGKFKVDLQYLQNFRKTGDGVTYEEVFTGQADSAEPTNPGGLEDNQFRSSGTLGIGLRRYKEGEGFTPMPYPDQKFYFDGDKHLIPGTGQTAAPAIKWNIKPGMKPIKWLISPDVLKDQANPDYANYDLAGALKRGIESWNAVFGFPVIEAAVADPSASWADDDTNMVIYDLDTSLGFAFANWRTNPNTGEVRGASVYFSSLWVAIGNQRFTDDVATPAHIVIGSAGKIGGAPGPKPTFLTWGGIKEQRLCDWAVPNLGDPERASAGPATGGSSVMMTKKQKVEASIAHTIAHEIGHTLGLRHNFKGSTAGDPATSIMDYLVDEQAIVSPHPLPYDVDAIKYLYGLSTEEPKQPFCTDEDSNVDPECNQFDVGADPLNGDFVPRYSTVLDDFLNGRIVDNAPAGPPNTTLNNVLEFVRASGDPAKRLAALKAVLAPLHVGAVPAAILAVPGGGKSADFMLNRIVTRLYLDPSTARGSIVADPPADPALVAVLVPELKGTLLNSDTIRSWESRRSAVDVLKKMQGPEALVALRDAKAALEAARAGLAPTEQALTDDLLSKIAHAIDPYFTK